MGILKQREIEKLIEKLNDMVVDDWKSNFVLTGKWWILFILTIVPWFLWWKIVDKKRITEILLFGFFIVIISTFLDIVGWNFSLWMYPKTLIPLCTPLVPVNYTLLPIGYMLIYQYLSNWNSFVKALIFMSAFFAFILEPLSEWMNFYKELNWSHTYSFLIYIFIGMIVKWLLEKMMRIQKINS
ncbi:MAG: CBO0543 family protein [Bacillota bacterium]